MGPNTLQVYLLTFWFFPSLRHGIIKVMSLDQQQKPVVVSEVAKESDSSGSEDDDG